MRPDGSTNSITWLGKTFRTSGTSPMTDEEYREVVEYLYRRPSLEEVDKELKNLSKGGTKTSNIIGYYVKDLMYQTRHREDAWSIDEAVCCKKILEYFKWKVERSPNTFTDTSLGKSIEAAMRLCGIRCCRKVSNFPVKTMDEILRRYLPHGGNFYDYSCGWAHRMLSAIKNHVTYYGTDPNSELISRLEEISDRCSKVTGEPVETHLYPTGSEVHHSEMDGKIDLAFSSPPYYDLEIYRSDNQSISKNPEYSDWLCEWWLQTIANIHQYLKLGGIFGLNVKDLRPYNVYETLPGRALEKDMTSLVEQTGWFEPVEILPLSNIRRPFEYQLGITTTEEKVFVYKNL